MDLGPEDEEGALGEYVVLGKAVVSRNLVYSGDKDVVGKVPVGARVKVLEVRACEEEQRIRGRLKKPAGWISLVNTETGRRTILRGSIVLSCETCAHSLCMHCLQSKAPLQAWTFHVTASVKVDNLGFQHMIVPPMRVVIQRVEPGSWAERVGIRPCDELTAINGVSVDQVTPQELLTVLGKSRPLDFNFVYNGPDETAFCCRTPRAGAGEQGSVAVSLFVQNVDFTLISADTQLFANFKSIMRHTVAEEAEHGVMREHVELSFTAGPVLEVRCVVRRLSEADASEVRELLAYSATLGAAVTLALNRLPKLKSTAAYGPVSVVKVEVEPAKDRMHGFGTPNRQSWPHFMVTRSFLKRFNRQPSPSPVRSSQC